MNTTNNGEDEKVRLIVECDICKELEEKIQRLGELKYKLPSFGLYVIEIPGRELNKLRGVEGIRSVRPDTSITAQMNTSRKVVCAEKGEYTGRGITIAILDTGVAPVDDFIYPKNRILAFKDFINGRKEPYDDNAHGTHIDATMP